MSPSNVLDFLAGGGDMGALIRAYPWADSALRQGPEDWPTGLRTALRILLTTQHPIFIFWGPEHVCFYNDAYCRSLGPEKHPAILGQAGAAVWQEIWPTIGPQIEQVLNGGGATWHENQLVPIIRHGELQEVYWTYSFGPIDEPTAVNGIGGVLVICTETTQQILSERRITIEHERFEQLFQQAPSFMALLRGPNHLFEFANPAYMRLVANRPVVGRTVAEALPEAVKQGYVQLLDEVYKSGEVFSASGAQFTFQRERDGDPTERYMDFVYQAVKDSAGQVWGIFVEGVDVTDRIYAEGRRTALIHFTDAVRFLKTQEEVTFKAAQVLGEILQISRVGYGSVDADAETLRVLQDWHAAGVHPVGGTFNLRDFGSFVDDLRQGQTVAISNVAHDPRTCAAAASWQEQNAIAVVNVPVIENERLVAVLYLNNPKPREWSEEDLALVKEIAERTRTITQRLRSEAALLESEAKFRTIADAMPQMVWSTLPDGNHDYYNRQWYEYTGIAAGPVDDYKWRRLLHPEDQVLAHQTWKHSLATGEPYEIQYRLRHHSGAYRWTLGRALPVRDEAGKITRWMGTCTDIHDQKLAEEELRESSLRKDEFLAMLAHELRNPIAPISTAAQILKVARDEKHVTQASDIINRQVMHLTTLVDDLLDVSRVSRGLVVLEMEHVDIKLVVHHAIEQVRQLIEARRHVLSIRMESDYAFVKGDKTRLVQVVANLLNNAAKYTPQSGEIGLTVMVQDKTVKISVTDNGSGIAPSLLPHVFDLFTQGERTPDRTQGGLGLGLALVKNITGMHGGEVTACSAGSGSGSTFTLTLPLLETSVNSGSNPASELAMPKSRSLRVMIVDDNADGARSLGYLQELHAHHVLIKEDSASALQAAAENSVHVFILDIGLPDMDGYELARRLRANPSTTGATIIALTGYGQEHDRVLSKAAGFDHHFVKPVDVRQLERVLAQIN